MRSFRRFALVVPLLLLAVAAAPLPASPLDGPPPELVLKNAAHEMPALAPLVLELASLELEGLELRQAPEASPIDVALDSHVTRVPLEAMAARPPGLRFAAITTRVHTNGSALPGSRWRPELTHAHGSIDVALHGSG
jgi:hypothetical protein